MAARTDPVRQFPSPIPADLLLVETVSNVVATNEALQPGTRYGGNTQDQRDKWGAAVFLGQRAIDGNDKDVLRIWATDPTLQNLYNFAIGFSGEADAAPIFSRRYLVRRDDYLATKPNKLTTYSGVFRVRVTAGGEGYRENFTVTATGGEGTGFTALAIVNKEGEVEHIVVVAEGTGYTSAPTIVLSAGSGSGATAAAVVQGTACVLVEEKTTDAPDQWNSLFLVAERTYETLPGPLIPDNRDDLLLGPVQRTRRAVVNTGQAAVVTATGKTTYEGRDGSSIVSWEIVEAWSDGTGSSSNPLFPVIPAPIFYDSQRGSVKSFSQVIKSVLKVYSATVAAGGTGGTNGTQTVTGTTGTGTKFQALVTVSGNTITAVQSISVVGAYTVRPTDLAQEPVTGASLTGAKLSLTMDASETGTVVIANGIATETSYTPVDEFHVKRTIEYFAVPAVLLTKAEWVDDLECEQGVFQQLQNTPGTVPAIGAAYSTIGMNSGGAVTAIAIVVDGDSYSQPALVSVARGPGQRALAHSTMKADGVAEYTARGTLFVPGETLTTTGTGTASILTVATTRLISATIAAAGTGGSNGAQTATGTTGTGTKFVIAVTVAGGAITAVGAISVNGSYTVNPTTLASEPVSVSGGGLTDARLSLVMGINTVTISTAGSLTALPPIALVTAAPTVTGASYQALDALTLAGGTGTAPVLMVETLSGTASNGPIATVSITTAGVLTALPTATDPEGVISRANWTVSAVTSRISVGGAVTVNTGTDVVTSVAHGRLVGDRVAVDSTLTNPGGISKARAYFVKTAPTADTLTLSATSGGATLNITSSGTGTLTLYAPDATATGGGSGAEFTATYKANVSAMNGSVSGLGAIIPLTYAVNTVVVDTAGDKYTSAPVVTISGSTGTQATATATISAIAIAAFTGYVVDHWVEDVKGPLVRVHWKTLPVEELALNGYQTMESTTPWVWPGLFTGPSTYFHTPPWPGIDFSLIQPISADFPCLEQKQYKNGPFTRAEMYVPFSMINPGAGSRIFPIGERTIHNAISYYYLDGTYAEQFPASTVTGAYGALYCISCRQSRVIGTLHRLKTIFVSRN